MKRSDQVKSLLMNDMRAFPLSTPFTAVRTAAAVVLLAATLIGTTAPTFGQSLNSDPVIAVVNGTQIHEEDLRLADEMVGRNLPVQDKVERREALMNMMIDSIVLAQIARDRKIGDEADLQRRTTYARNQGLMNQLLAVTGQRAVNDDSVRKAYQDVIVKPASDQLELHLRHIFFRAPEQSDAAAVSATEEKAKTALVRIANGEDFAAVAADMSDDAATKGKGGDFDWRTRQEMGKEYADVAFGLKKGEVSPVIKTSFGLHIIKLEDQRPRKPVELEKIRDRIAAMVANTARHALIETARSEAKIERLDQPHLADGTGQSPK
jgi:peptidylprolyl isomerase/peptidyl-prolyl cis-trans isomerase C